MGAVVSEVESQGQTTKSKPAGLIVTRSCYTCVRCNIIQNTANSWLWRERRLVVTRRPTLALYIQEAAAAVHAVCMHATEVLLLESGRAGPASHCYHQRAASTPTSMCPPYTGIGIYTGSGGPLDQVLSLVQRDQPYSPGATCGAAVSPRGGVGGE